MRHETRRTNQFFVCGKCGAGNGKSGKPAFRTAQERNRHKRKAHGK